MQILFIMDANTEKAIVLEVFRVFIIIQGGPLVQRWCFTALTVSKFSNASSLIFHYLKQRKQIVCFHLNINSYAVENIQFIFSNLPEFLATFFKSFSNITSFLVTFYKNYIMKLSIEMPEQYSPEITGKTGVTSNTQ